MPMRQDCKYFESRSYPNGDTVRKCGLDLAPEAPWRCPADCPKFTRRLADVNWSYGSLVTPATPDEPESLGVDDSIAALLDAAEDIVNNSVEDAIISIEEEYRKRSKKGLGRLRRNKGKGDRGPSSELGNLRPKDSKSKGEGMGERFRRRYRNGR